MLNLAGHAEVLQGATVHLTSDSSATLSESAWASFVAEQEKKKRCTFPCLLRLGSSSTNKIKTVANQKLRPAAARTLAKRGASSNTCCWPSSAPALSPPLPTLHAADSGGEVDLVPGARRYPYVFECSLQRRNSFLVNVLGQSCLPSLPFSRSFLPLFPISLPCSFLCFSIFTSSLKELLSETKDQAKRG